MDIRLIELATVFGIFAAEDDLARGDVLTFVGREQTIEVIAQGGCEGFLSTVAMARNAVSAVVAAEPGFRSILSLYVAAARQQRRWRELGVLIMTDAPC